jgi:hypothetical protein
MVAGSPCNGYFVSVILLSKDDTFLSPFFQIKKSIPELPVKSLNHFEGGLKRLIQILPERQGPER